MQHNNTKYNYILSIWFDHRDIDWIRYYPMKKI